MDFVAFVAFGAFETDVAVQFEHRRVGRSIRVHIKVDVIAVLRSVVHIPPRHFVLQAGYVDL